MIRPATTPSESSPPPINLPFLDAISMAWERERGQMQLLFSGVNANTHADFYTVLEYIDALSSENRTIIAECIAWILGKDQYHVDWRWTPLPRQIEAEPEDPSTVYCDRIIAHICEKRAERGVDPTEPFIFRNIPYDTSIDLKDFLQYLSLEELERIVHCLSESPSAPAALKAA